MTEQQETARASGGVVLDEKTQLENERICEKLLGWRRLTHNGVTWWEPPSTGKFQPTMLAALSFETWDEAGLILDELQRLSYDRRSAADVLLKLGDLVIGALLTPAAIRAAVLALIGEKP